MGAIEADMTTRRIGQTEVLIPENIVDRDVLVHLMTVLPPDCANGYWKVKWSGFDPLTPDDYLGRIRVSWEDKQNTRQLDFFSICRDDYGGFAVIKSPNQ
jgi:hypothetical protein